MTSDRLDKARARISAMDLSVADLMSEVVAVLRPESLLLEAVELMARKHIRHIPIVGKDNKLVGLVTHRDVLKCSLSEHSRVSEKDQDAWLSRIPVSSVMQDDKLGAVRSISADVSLRTAAIKMSEERYGCLPVVNEHQELVGIITDSDFVKFFADGI